MLKYIAFVVIFAIIIVSYIGLQEETQIPINQSRESETTVKNTQQSTHTVPKAAKKIKSVDVSEEKAPDLEVAESTLPDESDDLESQASDEKAATVKRSQLIGGADVVWIEPEPKDENDKFGTPPE